ncbi:hypothetical protein BC826DRAFT_232371 [Russula brevipes]|nr:hypothetical protein BC826DRAFT_232371 [Russula brevipes]
MAPALPVLPSKVPASASYPDLHECAERQQATVAPIVCISSPTLDGLFVNPHPFGGTSHVNRSYGNLSVTSIQSRASDRLSFLSNPHESIHPPFSDPPRVHGPFYRQYGRRPDPPSPLDRPHTSHQPPRLEIVTTDLPSPGHGDGNVNPEVWPSASFSYTHELLSTLSMHGSQRKQTAASMLVDIQNPSTGRFRTSSSTHVQQIADEPFSIDSETAPSSPVSDPATLRDAPLLSPTDSAKSGFYLPDGRTVRPFTSDQVPRYTKGDKIPRTETSYFVPPLTTTFPLYTEPSGSEQGSPNQDCRPWIPATHPEGGLYFYDRERRLFTDTDMLNPELRFEMEDFYDYLQRLLRADDLSFPSKNYDLVLDIMPTEEGQVQWSYYYACHETRCLFWAETYDASYTTSEIYGVKSPAHVKHRLEALYWNHWSLFPVAFDDRRLPLGVHDELIGMLTHGCIDVMTSRSSTLPYDADTMQMMIKLVKNAKNAKGGEAYYIAGTARLLSFFAHWRFLFFHGQRHARLIREETVYEGPMRERSILITLLSPLLFLAPEGHLRELETLWVDDVIIETVWKKFMTKLLKEWEDLILWSTVMLAANVGFLACPGVILSNLSGSPLTSASDVVIFTSPTQIASCASMAANIGSIVAGLLLVRHHRAKQNENPAGAAAYLIQNTHRVFGLEPMAITFGLPWALLMWSIVIFFVALLLLCFTISNIPTRIFIGCTSVLVASLIVWCILVTWESGEREAVWYDSLAALRRTRRDLVEHVKQLGAGGLGLLPTRRAPQVDQNSYPDRQCAGV